MSHIRIKGVVTAAVAFSLSYSMVPFEAPRIKRKETINFANLMASVETVYVAPGKTKEYTLYGPWLDWATGVTFMGNSQTIVEKGPTFNSDGGRLKVKLTGSGARALRTATINIGCPPFTDCVSTLTFPVRVLSVGTLSAIDPDENVPVNSYRHFRITGTNLDNATVFLFRTDLNAVGNITNGEGFLEFNGTTKSCGTNRVLVRDAAEGGDFYPFPGGLDIRLATSCGYTPTVSGTITGGSLAGGPDLQPVTGVPLFRHIAPNRKVSSEPFCHGMYAQAVQATVKTITVANMMWGVKNTGASKVTTPFRVRLYRAGTLVRDERVDSLRAGASVTFSYQRPESTTEVARLGLVPPSTTMQLYQATGGECVQTVGQETRYDWQDPAYEIRVDPTGVVTADINRNNNNRSF